MAIQSYTDQLGYSVAVPFPPKRIVSLVPSQTELLFDLGLDEEVVGITKFCIHPEHWHEQKKIIGGTKKFHLNDIVALQPDLIIGNKEENYQEGIESLRAKFPVWMSDVITLPDAFAMMEAVGAMVDRKREAMQVISTCKTKFSTLKPFRKKSALYLIWQNPWMAVGQDTFINTMLNIAGFENIIRQTRYPEISADNLKSLNPEVVMLASEPYPFKEPHIDALKRLCPKSAIKLVDGEIFSWYGSRMALFPEYLKTIM